MAIVSLDGLTKVYDRGHPPAAEDITLEIGHGELMVLLGPSGCGKTTTLRMIAGLESISAGRLSIDGQEVNRVPAKDRDIAMVFQSYALYPHMKVRDNLAFGLRRRRVPRDEIAARVQDVAATLELTPLLDRKPHALSGGQRQRVALGRAIVRDPKVFLFDEPLSNLDAALRVSTRGEIAALHRRLGATMVYVTHDQVEAMTLGTRICIMNRGRIAQVGRPLEIYGRPNDTFVASFLGNPPMNLLPATVVEGVAGSRLAVGEALLDLPADRIKAPSPGTAVTFGIRPEQVTLRDGEGVTPSDGSHGAETAGEVTQIEALGAETVLSVRLPGLDVPVIARLAGTPAIALGAPCRLHLDLGAAHVFDSDGKSLVLR